MITPNISTLYVQRKLVNSQEFTDWAKAQGFPRVLEISELHVTVVYSRTPVAWDTLAPDTNNLVVDNVSDIPAVREVSPLGDTAVVLKFSSKALQDRHDQWEAAGASWDYPEYQSHVTITYKGSEVDLTTIQPYTGPLMFGPEIYEPVNEDYVGKVVEKSENLQSIALAKDDIQAPDLAVAGLLSDQPPKKKLILDLSWLLASDTPDDPEVKKSEGLYILESIAQYYEGFTSVFKANPYHGKGGQFTSKDKAVHTSAWGEVSEWGPTEEGRPVFNIVSKSRAHLDSLNEVDRANVKAYTDNEYYGVNTSLRKPGTTLGKPQWDDRAKSIVESLDKAMSPVSSPLKVFRGVNGWELHHEMKSLHENGKLVGSVLKDPGFTSSTTNKLTAQMWDDANGSIAELQMEITVPKGHKVAYVGTLEPPREETDKEWKGYYKPIPPLVDDDKYARKPDEREVIIDRGTHFRVDSASVDESGRLTIKTTAIKKKRAK